MTKKSLILGSAVLAIGLFTGCSNKINLSEYRPTVVQKNKFAPKDLTSHKINKAAIIEFKSYKYKNIDPSKLATNHLKTLLIQGKFVKIDNVLKHNKLHQYIKLVEQKKEGDENNINYHIFKGTIRNISYTPTYHPSTRWKDTKGEYHTSPAYWSYNVCSEIQMDILTVPNLANEHSILETECINHIGNDNESKKFFPYLINDVIKKTIFSCSCDINRLFAPKGYILDVKRKDNTIIAKISLGKKQGIESNMQFNIYDLQKDNNTGDINKYKIGIGKVGGNTIFNNTSWITVELDDNQMLKIGDLVQFSDYFIFNF